MKPKTITVFAQLCNMLPREPLIRISQDQTPSEDGRRFNAQKFNTWNLLCALIFCHLGRCTSLRCIEDGLFTSQQELHHARQAQFLRRSTLSYVNNHTNFSILETYYYRVLEHFREALALKFSKTYTKPVFSLDSTTITLCYSLFPWARYRSHKGGFKLHTALNHELLLPEVIDMTAGSVNDVKQAKAVIRQLPPDSIVVMDCGYNDYELFSWLSDRGTTFVTRLKDNALTTPLNNRCLASVPGEWSLHSFEFCGIAARCCEGKSFRLVCWNDTENLRWFRFISNAENLTGPQIAQLYRDRWKIELFFKKLKQNLRVQNFIGRSPNAVMNQIWGAMISVLLVDVLLRQAKYPWSFSRLFDHLSMNLLTHNNLMQIIERPNLPTESDEASLERVQQRLFD